MMVGTAQWVCPGLLEISEFQKIVSPPSGSPGNMRYETVYAEVSGLHPSWLWGHSCQHNAEMDRLAFLRMGTK